MANISAGGYNSLLHTVCGRVFAFGKNSHGQLGLGDRNNRLVPEAVTTLDSLTIVQMATGDEHSLFLTDRGQVLACGLRTRTPLAHVDGLGYQLVPKIIESFGHVRITQIAAGESTGSLFLGEDGQALQALVSGERPDCRHTTRVSWFHWNEAAACVEPVICPPPGC